MKTSPFDHALFVILGIAYLCSVYQKIYIKALNYISLSILACITRVLKNSLSLIQEQINVTKEKKKLTM